MTEPLPEPAPKSPFAAVPLLATTDLLRLAKDGDPRARRTLRLGVGLLDYTAKELDLIKLQPGEKK